MVIVHIDFTGTYNEETNYQENLLPRANVLNGNDVYFVTTCYRWKNGVVDKVPPCRVRLSDGVNLIRVPYAFFGGERFEKRFRAVSKLRSILEEIQPNIIFLHCVQTAAVFTIVKYIKHNPNVILYADTHTDFNNSASGVVSRNILHGILYRHFCRKLIPYVRRLFYITEECRIFIESMYGFPPEKMEYLPLGGFIQTDSQYYERRKQVRDEFNMPEDAIVCIHSGKLSAQKKTDELVLSFHKFHLKNEKLLIAGSLDDEMARKLTRIFETDNDITYLGWVNGERLSALLCAADMYIQPGTQSATMQTAACCRCALALFPYESHVKLLGDAAFYIKNSEDIKTLLQRVNTETISQAKKNVFTIASTRLDYMIEAKRIEENR